MLLLLLFCTYNIKKSLLQLFGRSPCWYPRKNKKQTSVKDCSPASAMTKWHADFCVCVPMYGSGGTIFFLFVQSMCCSAAIRWAACVWTATLYLYLHVKSHIKRLPICLHELKKLDHHLSPWAPMDVFTLSSFKLFHIIPECDWQPSYFLSWFTIAWMRKNLQWRHCFIIWQHVLSCTYYPCTLLL